MDDSTVTRPVRWAVLGPGNIARRFASQLPHSEFGTLAGVGSSDPGRARAFAEEFGLGADAVLGTYDAVVDSAAIDAVYLSTVHTTHPPLAIAALEAGKHVLCEKPLAANHASGDGDGRGRPPHRPGACWRRTCTASTRRPATVLELIADGVVGDGAARGRLASRSGPVSGPVGCSIRPPPAAASSMSAATPSPTPARSWARRAGEPCWSRPRSPPRGTLGPTGIDEWAVGRSHLPRRRHGERADGRQDADPTTVTVHGSRAPAAQRSRGPSATEQRIVISTVDGEQVVEFSGDQPYGLEADGLARAAAGDGVVSEMSLADSLGNAAVLDTWREQIGLRYPFEADDSEIPTVSGEPLQVRADAVMPYGKIDGLDLTGVPAGDGLRQPADPGPRLGDVRPLLRRRRQRVRHRLHLRRRPAGATARPVDRQPRVRDQVAILVKGAHTPHCDPESITSQLPSRWSDWAPTTPTST